MQVGSTIGESLINLIEKSNGNVYNSEDIMSIPTSLTKQFTKVAVTESAELELA